MKTFWIRTASATVYALLFLGSIYSGRLIGNDNIGVIILTAFALFVTLGCTFEYFRIAEMQGNRPNKVLGYFYATVTTAIMSLIPLDYGEAIVGIVIVCFAILFLAFPTTLILQLWRHGESPFGDVLHTLLPTIYCALPLGLMSLLHYSNNILVMCIIMVWVNDSFAYMGGSLVGKHKMWPRHSPGKTWEGTAIGLAACVAVGIFVGPLFQTSMTLVTWIVLAIICSVIGTLGDLAESMLKRSVGLKDSGNIMPGHGGFLDRFDSLLAILPFALILSMFN